jgi:hypothetical protein
MDGGGACGTTRGAEMRGAEKCGAEMRGTEKWGAETCGAEM